MPNTSRLCLVLLFVSLAVNLFLGGLMLGNAYDPPPHTTEWARRGGSLAAALPKADLALLKASMEKNGDRLKVLKKDFDAARARTRAALESGDDAALESAVKAEVRAKTAFLRLIHQSRAAAAKEFSPEGRAVLEKTEAEARARYKPAER